MVRQWLASEWRAMWTMRSSATSAFSKSAGG